LFWILPRTRFLVLLFMGGALVFESVLGVARNFHSPAGALHPSAG
jgi:hypothetical protein